MFRKMKNFANGNLKILGLSKVKVKAVKNPILTVTVSLTLLALALDLSGRQGIANGLLIIVAFIAIPPTFIGMNRTLKSGFYGINLLPLVALITALFVGQYWAAAVLALLLTIERPLVAWFRGSQSDVISAAHAPLAKLLDRFSVPFTIFIFLVAGALWVTTGDIDRFLEVVAIASPAPFILAAPVAFLTGLQQARSHGIYVRSATILERLGYAASVSMSKNGVMTTDKPSVLEIKAYGGHTKSEVLRAAAALASQSEHSLAKAIVGAAVEDVKVNKAKHAREVAGMGITGRLRGNTLLIGSPKFLESEGVKVPSTLLSPGKTTVLVAEGSTLLGSIAFKDELKDGAALLVTKLRKLGIKTVTLLSNGPEKAVAATAQQMAIKSYVANADPSVKIQHIQSATMVPTVFIGDAHQDAAALTAADVAVTFGRQDTGLSDVTIEDGSIKSLIHSFTISKRTLRKARLVSLLGLFVTFALVVIAATGTFTALESAALQSILVFLIVSTASYVNLKAT